MGPKYLKGFWSKSDWEKRAQLIQQARNGGSLTPAMMTQLRQHSRKVSGIITNSLQEKVYLLRITSLALFFVRLLRKHQDLLMN